MSSRRERNGGAENQRSAEPCVRPQVFAEKSDSKKRSQCRLDIQEHPSA